MFLSNFLRKVCLFLFALKPFVKRLLITFADILASLFSVWLSFSLRLGLLHWPGREQWIFYLLAPALMLPFFMTAGLYRIIYRLGGFAAYLSVVRASVFYGVTLMALLMLLHLPDVPLSLGILQPLLFLLMAGGTRILVRYWYYFVLMPHRTRITQEKLLIYGAGSAGSQIANALYRSNKFELVGFIDDDHELHGRTINNIRVFSLEESVALLERQGIKNILLAMPSASRTRCNEIISFFRKYRVHIQKLPGVEELADGKVTISDIKEVDIEDLLGRDPVPANLELLKNSITGSVVMVTGAGGSIGSELCRQLLDTQPLKLLLVDQAEFNLYTIHRDLQERCLRHNISTILLPLLCDVTDEGRMDEICGLLMPKIIYHAAAYKHVPLVEHNAAEGVRNNVAGTKCVAEAALRHGVSNVVLVSTDKAVRPTNIMGASKRLCEMILQALASEGGHHTCFSMVRFGNVLGSSGSVIPLFRSQIKAGGPVTITHKEVTRYFMTIPEAAQLVIEAGLISSGGEVYLLDMGERVKIIDLALHMVELSGLSVRDESNPDGDIEIRCIGLRPGEKLYEELLIGDSSSKTANPRILMAYEEFKPWAELQEEFAELRKAISTNDVRTIKLLLKRIVPEYQPAAEITDLLAIESALCEQLSMSAESIR